MFELKKKIDLNHNSELVARKTTFKAHQTLKMVQVSDDLKQLSESDDDEAVFAETSSVDLSDEEQQETEEDLRTRKENANLMQKKLTLTFEKSVIREKTPKDSDLKIHEAQSLPLYQSQTNLGGHSPKTSARPDDVHITRVEFKFRKTLVFRSDGQVDFITSDNQVYSSTAIDFHNLQVDPISNPILQK